MLFDTYMCQIYNDTNLCLCQHKFVSCAIIILGDSMETYEILKELRENRDLTQQNIADLLKIGRTMYRRYETGETEIPVRHLKVLCAFYGVTSDYILGLTDKPKNK